jgi:phospholipid/cholesterol/gamma-HCH transport system ATP-binding protein
MIVFDKVSFSYASRSVLNEISFLINAEEKVAILGGSGEGKTTLLKLILGLLRPDSGRIIIDGKDITEKTEEDLRETRMQFSIVFQDGALFDSLSVRENVAFCLREYMSMSEEQIDQKVREMLRKVGMEEAIDLMPEELSGGMQRRVAIIRAMAAFEPKMFLYDEPTSGLDPVNADIIYRLISALAGQGKGFVMVTHKVLDAVKMAERFIVLEKGRIIFDGGKETLIRLPVPEIEASVSEWRAGLSSSLFSKEGKDV